MTLAQRNSIFDEWFSPEAREDDVEPEHELNRRLQESLDDVHAQAQQATASEQAAFAAVDEARGRLALGSGSRNEILRLQRLLAREQERSAMADSATRAAEKWASASRENHGQLVKAQQRAIGAEAVARAIDIGTRYAEAIRHFLAETGPLETEIAGLNYTHQRRRGKGPAMVSPLADLRDELQRQARALEEGRVK